MGRDGCCCSDRFAAASEPLRAGIANVRAMSRRKLCVALLMALLLPVSSVVQMVAFNFWVRAFPSKTANNFTVALLVGLGNIVLYTSLLAAYWMIKRPSLRFLLDPKGYGLIAGAAACMAFTGVASLSAMGHTPMLFQALLYSTGAPWTFLFVKVIFAERRPYVNPMVGVAVLLLLAGILVGMAPALASSSASEGVPANGSQWGWSAIFALSIVCNSLMAVLMAKFIRRVSPATAIEPAVARKDGECSEDAKVHAITSTVDVGPSVATPLMQRCEEPRVAVDSVAARLGFLVMGMWTALAFLLLMVPLNALPWFGNVDSVSESYNSLLEGLRCTFNPNSQPACHDNYAYFLAAVAAMSVNLFTVLVLVAYSPSLVSILGHLSSPLAALILLAMPVSNASSSHRPNLWATLGAIVLLVAGTVIFALWEEATRYDECDSLQREPDADVC